MWYHLEVDGRVFRSFFGNSCNEDLVEEHREIQQLIDDMIMLVDSAVIEKLGTEALSQYCAGLEQAFGKICKLLEVHITRENAILEQAQQALNQK